MSLNEDYESMKQNMRNTGLLTEEEIEATAEEVLKLVPVNAEYAGDALKDMLMNMEGEDE